ncbi:MAG: hypothetical protein RIF41_27915 [Polyangiaceae bacterium]
MAKKAFSKSKPPTDEEPVLETPTRDRQFALGKRSAKQPATYKISADVRDDVEMRATELTRALGRKVWPAHIVEAALRAYLAKPRGAQQALLDEV